MKKALFFLVSFILGLGCILLYSFYVPRTVPSTYIPSTYVLLSETTVGNLTSLSSEATVGNQTPLPSETNVGYSSHHESESKPEPVTDQQQLCLSILQRTERFRQSLLRECEYLVGNHTVIKTFLEKTLAYLSWHNNITTQSAPARRTLTWQCLRSPLDCGGYGDQIRGMAYTFVLALLTDRVLYIQWLNLYTAKSESGTSSLEDTMFVPNAINWSVPSFLSKVTAVQFIDADAYHEASGVCKALYSQTEHITYNTMHFHPTCFKETIMGDHTASVALKELINTPTKVLEFAIAISVQLLLKYSKAVRERKEEIKTGLGIGPDTHFAALHIRTGMFASGVNEALNFPKTESKWEKELECALNKTKALGVTGPLVLVSDSVQCKQWARKRYGERVLTSDIAPLHIAKDTNSWTDQTTIEDKMQRYRSVLASTAELAFMSDATAVVMAYSGFSRISTWLGGLSDEDKLCCYSAECGYELVYSN